MKFLLAAVLSLLPLSLHAQTGLSTIIFTNANKKDFKVDLTPSTNPTNRLKINFDGPGSPDGPGDLFTYLSTNQFTLWVLTNGVLRPTVTANAYWFGTFDGTSPTNVPQLTLFGVNPASGATIDSGSSNIIAGGYYPLLNATWKGVSEVMDFGQNVLANSGLTNVADVHAQGNFVFQGLKAATSSNLYGHGHSAGQGATITGSGNLFFDGNESGLSSTFTSDFDLSFFNGAAKSATIHDSRNMVAWGVDTLSGVSGAWTNAYAIGTGAATWFGSGANNIFGIGPEIVTSMGDLHASNTFMRGAEVWVNKSVLLSLGANTLAAAGNSQWNLLSPTNDPSQVTIALNHGVQDVQKLVIFNITNGAPAGGAFKLTNGTPTPDLGGGYVQLMGGRDWVATNGSWIALEWHSPIWYETDDRNVFTGAGGADTWHVVASVFKPFDPNYAVAITTNATVNKVVLTSPDGATMITLGADNSALDSIFTGAVPFSLYGTGYSYLFQPGNIQPLFGGDLGSVSFPWTTLYLTDSGSVLFGANSFLTPSSADGTAAYHLDTTVTHTTGNLVEFNNNSVNRFSFQPAGFELISSDSLGDLAAQNVLSGLAVRNTTAAALGAQQSSPSVIWAANGWSTATNNSQPIDFGAYVQTFQGTPTPNAVWNLQAWTNGATPTTVLRVKSTSGWDGSGTHVFRDDGTFGAVPGGGGVAGTVVNTVAPNAAGVPLVFRGTDTTNAVPGYTSGSVSTVTGNQTIVYTQHNAVLKWNSTTNCNAFFTDGATNGFKLYIKNLGAGFIVLTNTSGKTFDGLASMNLPVGNFVVGADGANYITTLISPQGNPAQNLAYMSPNGSSGPPTMRAIVAADLPAGTTPTGANPSATVSGSAVNGSSANFMRSDAAPALANTAVSAGSYGSATQVGTFTVDAQGRLTSAGNTTISGVASAANWTASGPTNSTLTGNALVNAITATNGITGSSGAWLAPSGTAAAPAIAWLADNDGSGTGIFRRTADTIGFVLNGTEVAELRGTLFDVGTTGIAGGTIGADDAFIRYDSTATWQLGTDGTSPVNQTLKANDATGTDHNGGNLTFEGGQATGVGVSGALIERTAPTLQTTGSTANSYVNRKYLAPHEVAMTSGSAVLVFNVSLASGKTVGLHVFATTRADNATDFQCATDDFTISAVNKGGTVTATLSATVLTASQATSGTITTAWTAVANGNGLDIKNTETSTVITPTTNKTMWRVEIDTNDTGLTVTVQ